MLSLLYYEYEKVFSTDEESLVLGDLGVSVGSIEKCNAYSFEHYACDDAYYE